MATCDNHIGECTGECMDLVDEMQWEDVTEFETLESAGLEDSYNDDTVPGEVFNHYYSEEA